MSVRILEGDALSVLRSLPSESVQCVVTSPPYFGLRAYGTDPQVWGGNSEHAHEWGTVPSPGSRTSDTHPGPMQHPGNTHRERLTSDVCACGAWRGELGLEPTPALFVEHLVAIFEEVKRVLRSDGLCFVNLSDSYWTRSAMRQGGNREQIKAMAGEIEMPSWKEHAAQGRTRYSSGHPTLKDKDLTLIPQRFAIAMQDAGWWVRSQIAWCKLSAMPESVRDRPTSAWEPIWMFAKSARYFYDAEAVRQPAMSADRRQPTPDMKQRHPNDTPWHDNRYAPGRSGYGVNESGANLRNWWALSQPMPDAWMLGPSPLKEAHYAAFVPELVRRCVLAGTSQAGACRACGSPWTRVVERAAIEAPRNGTARKANRGVGRQDGSPLLIDRELPPRTTASRGTTGWQPSCSCQPAEPRSCVVLDCFGGSGTTGLVADRLGRDAILIELSPTYAAMCERRLRDDAPMFVDVEAAERPVQASLFGEVAG